MRIGLILGTITLTATALASTAHAGPGCAQHANSVAAHIFDTSDADGSGALSPEEYAGAGLERYGMTFEAFDANGDGETSREEYLNLFRRHHPPTNEMTI